jgi:cytochrome b subunit of formate dehydrogenase
MAIKPDRGGGQPPAPNFVKGDNKMIWLAIAFVVALGICGFCLATGYGLFSK